MKILVLAGGSDQIALINELKRRGHYIVLVDYFDNPPAKSYADKHIVASTLDVEKVEQIAKSENADLICTACTDQALLTVSYVSEKLGLPCYIDYQTGLNVTNKSYMKKVLLKNNIPTAKFVIVKSPDVSAVNGFTFPLVVKPVDCNSSKGVKKVESLEEFRTYVAEAINYSRTKSAIVEEFKEGIEISADFYIENGVAKFLSATNSLKIRNRKSFTILCSDYPAITGEQEVAVTKIATDIAKAFLLNNTPLLVQLIVKDSEINVIEFSARMGGGSKYKLIEVLSGVDIMSKYVDLILGDCPHVHPSKQVDYCKMVYIYCYPGVYDRMEGLEQMKSEGVIDDYFLYKTKGMEIQKAETSGDRPAGYLCSAKTSDDLWKKIEYIDSQIKAISSTGEDMMIHGLLTR
jgi:phosphoribosylamine-glycine ligase